MLRLLIEGPCNVSSGLFCIVIFVFVINFILNFFRYVEYFAGLLAGSIKVNASPLLLSHVTVVGAPPMSHVFLKLYEGIVPIYTSSKCLKLFKIVCIILVSF